MGHCGFRIVLFKNSHPIVCATDDDYVDGVDVDMCVGHTVSKHFK
jgi:hypothetical protein